MTIGKKLIFYGVLGSTVPLLLFGIIAVWQGGKTFNEAEKATRKQAYINLESITKGTNAMLIAQHEVLERKVATDLNVAANEVKAAGGVHLTDTKYRWNARNQYTGAEQALELPQMLVGTAAVTSNADPRVQSPIVDKVRDLVGGTCTIFQRMNAAGSMLRVATNVETKQGTRAINTFIPAINPDGNPNPVLQKVLRGERYIGRAFVVNAWYITAYEPIKDITGNIVGMLYVGIPQESATSLREQIMQVGVGETGYVYVLNSSGAYVISKQGKRDGEVIWDAKDHEGKNFIQDMVKAAQNLQPGEVGESSYIWKNPGESAPRLKSTKFMYFEPWDWIIAVGSYENELLSDTNMIRAVNNKGNVIMAGVFILCLIACALLWFFISKGLTRPIQKTMDLLTVISAGDLSQDVEPEMLKRKDEIGSMMQALQAMVINLRELLGGLADGVTTLVSSSGELTGVSTQTAAGVESMAERSNTLAAAAEEASSNTASVATGMDHTTHSLSSVASATEEMSATVGEIASNSEKARDISEQAMNQTQIVTGTMQSLGEAAQEIDKVTETITEISSQTNLLALNATIEAARAGTAGKGFAVVAGEIKELARQTAEATEDIKRRISGIQTSTGSAISDIAQITQVIQEVGNLVNSIAAGIEEQSVVTRDVAGNIAQASAEVNDANDQLAQTASVSQAIAKDVAAVNLTVDEIRQGNGQLQNSTTELSALAERLSLMIKKFKVSNS